MARLIAIGGGTYEETDEFNRIAAEMTGKPLPNALFIGTAMQDSTNPLTSFKKSFKRACPGAQVKKLSVIRTSYPEQEINDLLSWADVIFIGGGNTVYMLEEWKKIGLDRKLKEIAEKGEKVISGISAGAICWFASGYTDSAGFSGNENWEYEIIRPETAVYPEFFCPHYNDARWAGFNREAAARAGESIALEDCTAFIDRNGVISYVSVKPERHAYRFVRQEGETVRVQMV